MRKCKHNYEHGDMLGEIMYIHEVESKPGKRKAKFKCHCGNEFETLLIPVANKEIKSCGCVTLKNRVAAVKTHGATGTVEHEAWNAMKRRCKGYSEQSKKNYKDRGITVCDRWLEPGGQGFINFLEDMGLRPGEEYSLDRKNNDLGYSPENCRWATREEQQNNISTNHNIDWNGKTQSITKWAKELGYVPVTFCSMYSRLGSIDAILSYDPKEAFRKVEYEGKMYTYQELADSIGMSRTGFQDRLRSGLSIKEALEKPLRGKSDKT